MYDTLFLFIATYVGWLEDEERWEGAHFAVVRQVDDQCRYLRGMPPNTFS